MASELGEVAQFLRNIRANAANDRVMPRVTAVAGMYGVLAALKNVDNSDSVTSMGRTFLSFVSGVVVPEPE